MVSLAVIGSAPSQAKADTPLPGDNLRQGLKAFNKYDLKQAKELLTKYKDQLRKAGQTPEEVADEALAAIPLAEDMLAGRVEQLIIIDSIPAAKDDVLNAYKLSIQAGRIFEPQDFNDMGGDWAKMTPFGTSYESEDGTLRYVGVSEEVEEEEDDDKAVTLTLRQRIYEGFKLADGTWSTPVPLFGQDVEAAYPYMLSDGCTFYFASRSETGLGGYDIFRSYRDSETGEFQNPVNMGLPYNSPADDYLLAIDEYTGAGRWVTGRTGNFSETDETPATIYVFVPSEMRHNYDADTPNIKALAALWTLHFPQEFDLTDDDYMPMANSGERTPGWKLTWPDGADYTELRQSIKEAASVQGLTEEEEFRFTADGGKIYTRYNQLPIAARAPMQRYLEAMQALKAGESNLDNMRHEYRVLPSDTVRRSIDSAQKQVEELRHDVRRARNALYTALRT